jgi:hypothetical protein
VIPFDPPQVAGLTALMILAVTVAYFAYLLFMAGLDGIERKRCSSCWPFLSRRPCSGLGTNRPVRR